MASGNINSNALPLARDAATGGLSGIDAQPRKRDLVKWLIVIAAMIGATLEVLDVSITNVAIPQIQANLGATVSEVGWVNTGYIISNVIILPMTGWLAERFGRRNFFACSIILFTLASVTCATSHTLTQLVLWRVVQGLGGGGLMATGQVIMWEAFPAERKGVATAIFGMGVMIGPSLGLVAGGYITDNLSWPWIFYINVPFGILAALLTWFFVPNGERPRTIARVDLLGAAFLAIGMGALQTVLERGQEEDWFDSRLIVWLTVAAVLGLCSFVWWELSVHDPIVDLRVFRDRSLAVGTVFSFVVGIGLYATIFLLPLYLQSLQGNTAFETGMTMLPGTVASIFAFMLAGPLAQKVDPRWLLPIGVATFMMGTGMLGGLTTQAGTGDVIVPLILRGISLGFLFIPLNVAAIGSLPDGATDTAIDTGAGLINLARQLGGSIGIATFSTLLVRRQYFHRAVLVQHLDTGSVTVGTWLAGARSYLVQHGMCAASAHSVALFQMAQSVERQAYMLAFNDVFLCISATFLTCVPMILLFRKREVRHVPT